jgi:hypothetical protein
MNIIRFGPLRTSQLIPLGDNPPIDEGKAPGWCYFTEVIEHVYKQKPQHTAQHYATYIGLHHDKYGLRVTLQASLRVLFLLLMTVILLIATINGTGVVNLVMKTLMGIH